MKNSLLTVKKLVTQMKYWQNTPLCSATDGKAKSTEKDSSDDQKKKQKDEVGVSKVFGTYKLIYIVLTHSDLFLQISIQKLLICNCSEMWK